MNKGKLELLDGSSIELEAGASLHDMKVIFNSEEDMLSIWKSLTEENLKSVKVKDSNGDVIGVYSDIILESETSIREEGRILTSFNFRKKTNIEKRLDQIEEEIDIHTDAIGDLGETVSEMAEGGTA